MEKALTKYFWILNLATLALVAYLLAGGTGQLLAATVADILPEEPSAERGDGPRRPTRSVKPMRQRNGDDILARNIFDSTFGPVTPADVEIGDDLPAVSTDGDLPLVPCTDGKYQLLATVASSRDPAWSFATVAVNNEQELYRVGDAIDDRTVSNITWRYLFLRGSTDECYLDLFAGPEDKPKPKRVSLSSRGRKPGDLASGIQVDGPNERTVSRSLVDQALANPAQFARSVRVRPYKRNGEVQGFRLRRIKRGSPLEMLGAKKGDIIHSVNGVDLTSVDKALAAYQGLRSESQLQFDITRRGKPQTLTININ